MSLLQSESTESVAETAQRAKEDIRGEASPKTNSTSFRLARALFGGVLAFMASENLRNLEDMIGYAESEGAPMAETSVPAVSAGLLLGGLGIATWKLPRLSAAGVAAFLVSNTPIMHDFWAVDDEQEKQQQQIHFLKNSALLGGALAFLGIAQDDRNR